MSANPTTKTGEAPAETPQAKCPWCEVVIVGMNVCTIALPVPNRPPMTFIGAFCSNCSKLLPVQLIATPNKASGAIGTPPEGIWTPQN